MERNRDWGVRLYVKGVSCFYLEESQKSSVHCQGQDSSFWKENRSSVTYPTWKWLLIFKSSVVAGLDTLKAGSSLPRLCQGSSRVEPALSAETVHY